MFDNAVNTLVRSSATDTRVRNSIMAVPDTGIANYGNLDVQNTVFYGWDGWISSSRGIESSGLVSISYSLFDDLDLDYMEGSVSREASAADGNLHANPEFVDA